jgi:hypothetical protein
MTVIAWDGATLAADRQLSWDGVPYQVTKIRRFGKLLLGVCGAWDESMELVAWFRAGADSTQFPEVCRKSGATLIVVGDGRYVKAYESGAHPSILEGGKLAFGSGRDCAMVAMHLGKTAKEACRLASIYRTDCGCGVDSLTLR